MPNPPSSKTLEGEFILNDQPPSNTNEKEDTPKETQTKKVSNFGNSHDHKHSRAHFFSAFSEYPTNVVFPDQEEDEEVVLLIRRHFVTNVPWIILAIIFLAVPSFFPSLFAVVFPFIELSTQTQTFLLLSYYLVVFGFILVNFALWYFHASLVTNLRIIDMDLTNILTKHVAETRIDLIQDTSYTQNGAIRAIFNYGDVFIQTAGSSPNIEFDRAPRPAEIAQIIGDLLQTTK